MYSVDIRVIYIYITVVERTETKKEETYLQMDTYGSILEESNSLYSSSNLMGHLSWLLW